MLVRDVEGRINIISRKECKTDLVYYKKLYNIRFAYTKKFNNIIINNPKSKVSNEQKLQNDFSDD